MKALLKMKRRPVVNHDNRRSVYQNFELFDPGDPRIR
jgi:hypothetical protein